MTCDHRLCVLASGSLWMILIFPFIKSINVSFRHFGQNSGKFLSSVSFPTLTRVLFPHRGHSIQFFSDIRPSYHYLVTCKVFFQAKPTQIYFLCSFFPNIAIVPRLIYNAGYILFIRWIPKETAIAAAHAALDTRYRVLFDQGSCAGIPS